MWVQLPPGLPIFFGVKSITTIAYKNGFLAADTASNLQGVITPGRTKIARRSDGVLVGTAGQCAFGDAFRSWVLKNQIGAPPKIPDDSGAFIILPDGTVRIWDPSEGAGSFTIHPPFYARGSGREFALGAMHAGATAEEAVRAAIALDPATNGEIMVLSHGEIKVPKRKTK
jgi:hypothetical protein